MCWQCDNPTKTTDEYVREVLLPAIECHGWAVQAVEGGRRSAPFAYTVGLTEAGLPELLVTGMAAYRAAALLNVAAAHWLHAEPLPVHGAHLDLEHVCLELVDLPQPDAHLLMAVRLYGREAVTAQQLVRADDRGRWPWDRGHRAGRGGQPVLGPRAELRSGACLRSAAASGGG